MVIQSQNHSPYLTGSWGYRQLQGCEVFRVQLTEVGTLSSTAEPMVRLNVDSHHWLAAESCARLRALEGSPSETCLPTYIKYYQAKMNYD